MKALKTRLVRVSGTHYEMGCQHGRQCSDTIKVFANNLLHMIHKRSTETGLSLNDAFDATRKYLPHIQKYAPHLLEEMNGIADGAGLAREKIYLCNLRGDLIAPRPCDCTSFALLPEITMDRSILIGQNVDLPGCLESQGIVLHLSPKKGPSILTWTFAGTLAQVGINSYGLVRVGNGLVSRQWRKYGVPRYFMWRRILEQKRVEDAVQLVIMTERSGSGNLLLADRKSIVDIEMTASEYRLLEPQDGFITHSNSYLHPELAKFERYSYLLDSPGRAERLRDLIKSSEGKITDEIASNWLQDHKSFPTSICRHPSGEDPHKRKTITSVVAEPTKCMLHVCIGNPCTSRYYAYRIP